MRTYVSIDIDFFNGTPAKEVMSVLDQFFYEVKSRKIPVVAVMNHQQLTRFVGASTARTLINVDQHADIATKECSEFNCGTWVSYIPWSHIGHYHWVHRHRVAEGECSWDNPIFMGGRTRGHVTSWKRVSRRKVTNFPQVKNLLKDCVGVGFVLSPDFSDEDFEEVFRALMSKYNMQYVKGVRNEIDLHVKRKPVLR